MIGDLLAIITTVTSLQEVDGVRQETSHLLPLLQVEDGVLMQTNLLKIIALLGDGVLLQIMLIIIMQIRQVEVGDLPRIITKMLLLVVGVLAHQLKITQIMEEVVHGEQLHLATIQLQVVEVGEIILLLVLVMEVGILVVMVVVMEDHQDGEHQALLVDLDRTQEGVEIEEMVMEETEVKVVSNVEKKVICQKIVLNLNNKRKDVLSVEKKVICQENVLNHNKKEKHQVLASNAIKKVTCLEIVLISSNSRRRDVLNVEKKAICQENVLTLSNRSQGEEVVSSVVKKVISQENVLTLKNSNQRVVSNANRKVICQKIVLKVQDLRSVSNAMKKVICLENALILNNNKERKDALIVEMKDINQEIALKNARSVLLVIITEITAHLEEVHQTVVEMVLGVPQVVVVMELGVPQVEVHGVHLLMAMTPILQLEEVLGVLLLLLLLNLEDGVLVITNLHQIMEEVDGVLPLPVLQIIGEQKVLQEKPPITKKVVEIPGEIVEEVDGD